VHVKVVVDLQGLRDFSAHVYTCDTPLDVTLLKPKDRNNAFPVEIDGMIPVFNPPHLGTLVTSDDEKQGKKHQETTAADPSDRQATKPGSREHIDAALRQHCEFTFMDTPLRDVIEHLATTLGVNFVLDRPALDDAGIRADLPISLSIGGVSLAEFMDHWTEWYDLTWYVKHNIVLITTPRAAWMQLDVRVYRDNTPQTMGLGSRGGMDDMREVEPESWSDVGGPGSVVPVHSDLLVVRQMYDIHRKIEKRYADKFQRVPPTWDALPPTLTDTDVGN